MKSAFITYTYGLNGSYAEVSTENKEDFDISITDYEGNKATYLSKSDLIELGEWLIQLGKGKE